MVGDLDTLLAARESARGARELVDGPHHRDGGPVRDQTEDRDDRDVDAECAPNRDRDL